ncbi:MAG TPA: FtsX-like permease family protein [Terracidiphilus sp.]
MLHRESMMLLVIGVGLGLPLTLAATKAIKHQLFGLSAIDPVALLTAIAVVSAMTILATWIPARRAARVDPLTALRYE